MNRLDRRLTLLRAKREGTFDPDQPFLESAARTRAARKVRVLMRRQVPVALLTPRWSRPDRFLDELSVDLQVGRPRVAAHVVPLGVVHGRQVHEIWAFLLRSIVEACHLELTGPASQPMHAAGFRKVLEELLERTVGGPRRALLLHGVEHLDLDTLTELAKVLTRHHEEYQEKARFNLLFAGSATLPKSGLEAFDRTVLPDLGVDESIQVLHEYVDRGDPAEIELSAALVGGVPALLHAVGMAAEREGQFPTSQEALWRAIGPLAEELRAAVDIVAADGSLAERLEDVARDGTLPLEPKRDASLVRAGLLRGVPRARRPRVTVRAPLISQLAGMVISKRGEVTESMDGPTV
ncbi:MAG: hypothetical protein AB8H79_09835 [Myxococcota bacterium]